MPTFTDEAVKCLEAETGTPILTDLDLANVYRRFEATRIANGGEPSPFIILNPPESVDGGASS